MITTTPELLVARLAQELHLDEAQVSALMKNYAAWEEPLRGLEEAIRRSEAVTEDDLAIRINVRAYD